MIQVYKPGNRNFDYNGDYNLNPISCELSMKLKGEWMVTLTNSLDENLEGIVENAIISMDTPLGEQQLFMINEVEKNDDFVRAYAIPVFLANEVYFYDTHIVNKTAQDALDIMLKNTGYKGYSDISKANSAYYQEMCLNEAISGSNDNAFLNRWGGEPIYKNFEIYLNKHAGIDNGLRVEFGFNLAGVEEKVNMSKVVTRIRPKAFNGYLLPANETVDSPNIDRYKPRNFPPVVYEYTDIKLKADAQEGDAENGITICETKEELYAKLRERARMEYSERKADMPTITYNVQMVDLSKTDLYKGYIDLVRVSLGDTVHVSHRRLGIETTPRVIEMVYDAVTKSITSLTLGDYEDSYFDKLSQTQHVVSSIYDKVTNTIMAQRIAGVLNLMMTSLRAQKDIAKRQDVRAILFEDVDKSSPTFGALCIGTLGIQIAKQRNEINTDWKWGTAIDFEAINADYVITGILTDRNGKFYLNLDTGELRMKDGTFAGTISGAKITGSEIDAGTIKGTEIIGSSINGGNIKIGENFSVANDGIMRCVDAVMRNVTMESGAFKGKLTTQWDAYIGNNLYLNYTAGIISKISLGEEGDTVITMSKDQIRIGIDNNNQNLLSRPSISITRDDIMLNLNEDNHIRINSLLGVTMKTKGKFIDMNYDI